jgi:hypothetical protein
MNACTANTLEPLNNPTDMFDSGIPNTVH